MRIEDLIKSEGGGMKEENGAICSKYFQCYYKGGYIPVPLNDNYTPIARWSEIAKDGLTDAQIRNWSAANVALITGEVSNLSVIDIDDIKRFKDFAGEELFEELKNNAKAIVKTKSGGLHFWYDFTPELRTAQYQIHGFDTKGDQALINAPPSRGYSFLSTNGGSGKMPEEFQRKVQLLQISDKLPQLISLLQEIYTKGTRQQICLFLAGFLRKLGCAQEKAEQILKAVTEELEPEADKQTVQQRLSAVKTTYRKTQNELMGISGLQKVSEEILGFEESAEWVKKFMNLFRINNANAILPEHIRKAQNLLQSSTLLDGIISEFRKAYIGRDKHLKLFFLTCLFSRIDEETGVILVGDTSAGKSKLVETILGAFPDEDKLSYTYVSEKFLLHTEKSLRNKILYFREISGAEDSLRFLKTFLTEKKASIGTLVKTKNELKQVEIEKDTSGLVVITTTTKQSIDEELASRSFILPIEDTQELIRAVLLHRPGEPDYKTLRAIIKLLKHRNVTIPFIQELALRFPVDSGRRKRDFQKVVNLVKSHTFLHQYQRQIINNTIIATEEDYKAIFELSDLVCQALTDLTPRALEFLEWLKPKKPINEANKYPRATKPTVINWRKKLQNSGFTEERDNTIFVVATPQSFSGLPHPDSLFKNGDDEYVW